MKIPNAEYYSKQRSSVFQKVDLSGIDLAKIPIYEKSEEQLNEIIPLLKNNFLTKNLADEEIQSIAGAMKPEKFEVGQNIITYGDEGLTYYILSKGRVQVLVYKPGTPADAPDLENHIMFTKFMDQGCGFGELALIYNDKRSASIVAVEPCETYTLDGVLFKKIIIQTNMKKRSDQEGFMNSIKLFGKLLSAFSF